MVSSDTNNRDILWLSFASYQGGFSIPLPFPFSFSLLGKKNRCQKSFFFSPLEVACGVAVSFRGEIIGGRVDRNNGGLVPDSWQNSEGLLVNLLRSRMVNWQVFPLWNVPAVRHWSQMSFQPFHSHSFAQEFSDVQVANLVFLYNITLYYWDMSTSF